MTERTAVIGAGPAGLAAAYTLGKLGHPVQVFEASPYVGGMARSFPLWGQTVDLGPHRFFSSDGRVNRLWLEVVDGDYRMVERQTRVFFDGKLFRYPLDPWDVLRKIGVFESIACAGSFVRERFRLHGTAQSFEQLVRHRFGDRLYRTFFKTYSEKVWGVPCDRLSAEFARQRIQKLSLAVAARNALSWNRNNKLATLVDRFAYPLGGTGSVYQSMAEQLPVRNGAISLATPVKRIYTNGSARFRIELESGECQEFDHVISSMPLTHLIGALPDVPEAVTRAAASLCFRSTLLVYLKVAGAETFPDQWVYVHAPELDIGRITNYRNWIPELHGDSPDSILSLELWCNPGDAKWHAPDNLLVQQAETELRKTGLLGNSRITASKVIRVPNCYPIYNLEYRQHLDVIEDYVSTIPGLQAIGRAGAFKYNNQDHSLLMGLLAAENTALGRNHDLWQINTDDQYQEDTLITDTGLVTVPS